MEIAPYQTKPALVKQKMCPHLEERLQSAPDIHSFDEEKPK